MAGKQIDVRFFFDHFVLNREFLGRLQALLQELTPPLEELEIEGERMRLSEPQVLYQRVEKEINRPPSALLQGLQEALGRPASPRTCGRVEIWSLDKSICVLIRIDEFIFNRGAEKWGWGNKLVFQIVRPLAGSSPKDWARNLLEAACRTLKPAYAHAVHVDEYDAKNMCFDRGAEAIVVDWNRSIPGLYWLNYFGQPFSGVFGSSKILASLKDEAARIGRDGVLISLGDDPYSWDSEEYKSRERKVLKILGREYFFDRADPERETVVVDEIARMIESSPAGPFDPSKPSVLRVWLDELPDEQSEGGAS